MINPKNEDLDLLTSFDDQKKQFYYRLHKDADPQHYPELLSAWFYEETGHILDLDNPQTYNEKIQWLKLFDSTPLKTKLADKLLAREWVKEQIGEKYLVPLLGVWDSFDEIDFDSLPNRFVLKANHGAGWNIVVSDKNTFDKEGARNKFEKWLHTNFAFAYGLELHYRDIPPKIIAEEYLENSNDDLYDYKVWCFQGKPEYVMFLAERHKGLKMAFYDTNWFLMPFTYSYPRYEKEVSRPDNLDEILNLAAKLSKGFSHVRVDFYRLNDGALKFGEMTFTSMSGACKWNPEECDLKMGQLIKLPVKNDPKKDLSRGEMIVGQEPDNPRVSHGPNNLHQPDGDRLTTLQHPMRVLFVNHSIPPYEHSGTPISTLNHALGIKERGPEVAILIPSRDVQNAYVKEKNSNLIIYKVPQLDKYEVFFGDIEKPVLDKYIYSIERIIHDFQPEIVHINDYVFMPEEIVSLFSRRGAHVIRNVCNPEELCHLDAPVYFDGKQDILCSGPDSPAKCAKCYLINVAKREKDELTAFELDEYSGKIQRRFEAIRLLYEHYVDGVIFTDKSFRDYFKQFIHIPDSVIKINPRGFNFEEPRRLEPKKVHSGTIHIGLLGTLIPRKGIDVVLSSFEKISHLDNFILDIYGSDPFQMYHDRIRILEQRYPGKIKFHGEFNKSEFARIAATIDFALVPSNFETFNRVARELMYFGIPLIVTNFFGASIIEDHVNGMKVSIGDCEAFAKCIEKLVLNPSLIEKLSKGVIATRINTLHDEIDGIANFYTEIVKKKGLKTKEPGQYDSILETEKILERQIIKQGLAGKLPDDPIDEPLVSLQCFFADGMSSLLAVPLFANGTSAPGTLDLAFDLPEQSCIAAMRLNLHRSVAVIKAHSLVLERRHRAPLDLAERMVTTGMQFGECTYLFDGKPYPHIDFSPLPAEELKDPARLALRLYCARFGPQAMADCIHEMLRMKSYCEESMETAKNYKNRVTVLEAGLEYAKGTIKKLAKQLDRQCPTGKRPTDTGNPNTRPLSFLPVQQVQPGRIAVHLHLYYIDMDEELLGHVANMPFAFDLFITLVDGKRVNSVEQKARQLCGTRLANLYVVVVPNRGRDIGAFFVTLGSRYQQYDYICHVHSKKSLHAGTMGKSWCEYLFTSLFKDEDYIRGIFGLFAANLKIGLIYPATAEEMPYWCHSWLSNNQSARKLFNQLKINVDTSSYIDFPVGSMFWARSRALQPLFGLRLTFDDFPEEPIPNDGTLCHAIERSFCISAHIRGLTFAEVDIRMGDFSVGEGKKNLWQYWARSIDHLRRSLEKFRKLSFDIFDTMVTRPLLAPDHAFLLMQHKIELELNVRIDFPVMRKKSESLARERLKPGTDATLRAIYECFAEITGLPAATVERIRQIEIENEISLSLPREEMSELVTSLQRDGRKITFMSDMYLPSEVIGRILAKHGIEASTSQIMVSSETGMRKDTGEIWPHFLKQVAQIHVGDNEHSDIQMAVDNGVPSYHVMSPRRLCELSLPKTRLPQGNALGDSMYAGPVVARLFSSPFALHSTRGQLHISDPEELGYCVFGPVLLFFTTWLYKQSHKLKIQHLLFLAREGYLLQELFNMFSAQFGDLGVRTSYLLCSRRANSVPTIERDTDIRSILEIQYNGSLANLLETRFGIDPASSSGEVTLSHQRLYKDTIVLPKEIDTVYADVLNFEKTIYRQAEKEKKAYLAYLKNMGVTKENSTAVVDIGFAGTIQKYLHKLTAMDLRGLYFVTNEKARNNPLAKKMHSCFGSFVEFKNANCIYNYSLTLEAVLTAQAGQFIRFDDKSQPVFGSSVHTGETWPVVQAIHSGIIEYFRDAFTWFGDALLAHEPQMDTVVHFYRLMSEHPEIINPSLRDAMKVDDYYVSNGVINAFHYAAGVNKAIASQFPVQSKPKPVKANPSGKQTDLVSIVILTFNQLEYTKKCLGSIEMNTPKPYELILVDNASSDGTPNYLREYAKNHERVMLILNEENKGFAGGNNQGISQAKGKYILLLNNDVVVTEHWLERLLSHMERHPDVGMVGPMSNAISGPQLVQDVPYGDSMNAMQTFARSFAASNYGKTTDMLRLVGFCLLIRKEVFNLIGGLDENYGNGNYEDDDICLRSYIAGFRNIIARDVFIHHYGGMTFKGNGIDYDAALQGNLQYFASKWKDVVEVSGNGYRIHITKEQQIRVLLDWGEERFSRGDIEGAIKIFERILHLDRSNCEALNNIGVIQWQMGDVVAAIETFQIALGLNPKDSDALANLLQAATETGRFDLLKPNMLNTIKQVQPINPGITKLVDEYAGISEIPENHQGI